jgi:hypothetical protein
MESGLILAKSELAAADIAGQRAAKLAARRQGPYPAARNSLDGVAAPSAAPRSSKVSAGGILLCEQQDIALALNGPWNRADERNTSRQQVQNLAVLKKSTPMGKTNLPGYSLE